VWGATFTPSCEPSEQLQFLSARPVWGATRYGAEQFMYGWVSIRAPRVGRDAQRSGALAMLAVSIRAPRVGRDTTNIDNSQVVAEFLSARPVWGATRIKPTETP